MDILFVLILVFENALLAVMIRRYVKIYTVISHTTDKEAGQLKLYRYLLQA